MKLLAIDTAANLCSACVLDTQSGAAEHVSRDIGRGHAEELHGVVSKTLASAGMEMSGIARIAVSIGPGSFTGVRIGIAYARGLALGLGCPVTGVTTLEAIAADARALSPGRDVLCVLDARRGEAFVAAFDAGGAQLQAPAAVPAKEVPAMVSPGMIVAGNGAALAGTPDVVLGNAATGNIVSFARIAAKMPATEEKPLPLYLRAPDAKPQQGFAVARVAG